MLRILTEIPIGSPLDVVVVVVDFFNLTFTIHRLHYGLTTFLSVRLLNCLILTKNDVISSFRYQFINFMFFVSKVYEVRTTNAPMSEFRADSGLNY